MGAIRGSPGDQSRRFRGNLTQYPQMRPVAHLVLLALNCGAEALLCSLQNNEVRKARSSSSQTLSDPRKWTARRHSACTLSSHEAAARDLCSNCRQLISVCNNVETTFRVSACYGRPEPRISGCFLRVPPLMMLAGGWDDHSCHSNSPAPSVLVQSEWWKVCAMVSND